MRILFIGDIFAKPGRHVIRDLIPALREEKNIDFIIANAENAAGGFGVSGAIADELLGYGLDVLTSGNHIWNSKDIEDYLKSTNRLLRPLNYPKENPGFGSSIVESKDGIRVAVLNVCGRVFMGSFDCPFKSLDEIIPSMKDRTNIIVVDIHAEATSEKKALGYYLDGRVSLVVGTHTHVQTADEVVLPKGTAYISDVGMTGSFDSVIGVKKEIVISRFLTGHSKRFEPAQDNVHLNAVLVEVDEKSGKAKSIERIDMKLDD